MRFLLILALIVLPLFAACGEDTPTNNDSTPEITELWVVNGETYTSEPEAYDAIDRRADDFDASGCQHWTFDQGTWWIRNCGYTLSEQCMYFSGPTGEIRNCNEVGGGPGGNW